MYATTFVVLVLCIFCSACTVLGDAEDGCPEDNDRCKRKCAANGGIGGDCIVLPHKSNSECACSALASGK